MTAEQLFKLLNEPFDNVKKLSVKEDKKIVELKELQDLFHNMNHSQTSYGTRKLYDYILYIINFNADNNYIYYKDILAVFRKYMTDAFEIPYEIVIAQVFAYGMHKYGAFSRFLITQDCEVHHQAFKRHIAVCMKNGIDAVDEDSKIKHIYLAFANVVIINIYNNIATN